MRLCFHGLKKCQKVDVDIITWENGVFNSNELLEATEYASSDLAFESP